MQICVLQPGSRLTQQIFSEFAGTPNPLQHPPTGYHGFAACTGGGFYRDDAAIPPDQRRVLLVLTRNLKACRQAAINLRRAGKTLFLAWDQPGAFALDAIIRSPGDLALFRDICGRAHGAIAVTSELEPVFRGGGILHVGTIPTPLPVMEAGWDFSVRPELREGIIVGSFDLRNPVRRHLAALLGLREVAAQMYEPVTVVNLDGWRGRRWLRQLGYPTGMLRVIESRLSYPEYLRRMATHKLVFHLDASGGVGSAAGDALLCRVPCVGGNGVTERIVFPELCAQNATAADLLYLTQRLLDHGQDRDAAVEQGLVLARERLSFDVVQQSLEQLFHCFG